MSNFAPKIQLMYARTHNKMTKKIVIIALMLLPMMAQADLLDNLLDGEYNAKTLSPNDVSTILGDTAAGRWRIERENARSVFRHSEVADYYVYDTQTRTRSLIGGGGVSDVVMSPNGRYVAFIKDRGLYLRKLDFGTEVAVAASDNPYIYNGVSDWLYEEEFGQTCLFAFSPDSKQIAFVRLDESHVPVHRWENYLDGWYPTQDSLYYPKAGTPNAKASVHVYDIRYKKVTDVHLGTDTTRYIPRIRWSNPELSKNAKEEDRAGELIVVKLNRDQTRMEVLSGDAKTTIMRPLYEESAQDQYIDYELFDEWIWLRDNRIIAVSEKDGWRQVYLMSALGTVERKLTPATMDVTKVYGVDETTGTLYYQAAPTARTRQCFAVALKGGIPVQITSGEGTNSLLFSANMKKAIGCFQSVQQPNVYTEYDVAGVKLNRVRVLEDNAALKAKWQALHLPEAEWMEIPNHQGEKLTAYMLRPTDMDSTRQYPMLMLQYSGPASQRVLNRWRKRWDYYVVQQGYVVVWVDTRGTDCRGRAWRNESYMQLGQKEADDLIAAAEWMGRQTYIDSTRMALCGWSYGGFMTLMVMQQPQHPFRCGMAIAPVTNWRLYDSAYTERYMRRPQVNAGGYFHGDLTRTAHNLKGNLLLVHGMADDNVHVQNTMRYIEALVKADKQFELQLYPDDNHQLRKRNNYKHLHRRLMRHLDENLK